MSTKLHKGCKFFHIVILPLCLRVILFLFCFDFWFMKVIPVCTALGRSERLLTVCEQETASLGLREPALVRIPFSGILNGGKKGLRSSAPCLHMTFALCLSFRTTGVWKHHQLCRLFFPSLPKVSCWTSESKGLDMEQDPCTLIDIRLVLWGLRWMFFSGAAGVSEF